MTDLSLNTPRPPDATSGTTTAAQGGPRRAGTVAAGWSLRCPVCERHFEAWTPELFTGCPDCLDARNLRVGVRLVSPPAAATSVRRRPAAGRDERCAHRAGPWAWPDRLPVPVDDPVTLGEGGTPLVPVAGLGPDLPRLLIKDETRNPTFSHKDRGASVVVSVARAWGATGIVGASSGNAGLALCAYAARAGLPCTIFVAGIDPLVSLSMAAFGATVVQVATADDRFRELQRGVRERGWFAATNPCAPPVGSPPFAAAGYRSIAYEIFEELGRVPEAVLLPVGYGDLLTGVCDGFADLVTAGLAQRLPRIVGIEASDRLSAALRADAWRTGPFAPGPEWAFAIAGDHATTQAVDSLRRVGGTAAVVDRRAAELAHQVLATRQGLLFERSSLLPVAAVLDRLVDGLGPADTVVAIGTSTGMKELARFDTVAASQ